MTKPLTRERLLKVVRWDEDVQRFRWTTSQGGRQVNALAGTKKPNKPRRIHLLRRAYYEDDLITLLNTGSLPQHKANINSKSGIRGVVPIRSGKTGERWVAQYRRKCQGCFSTKEEAKAAYDLAVKKEAEAQHWAKHSMHCSLRGEDLDFVLGPHDIECSIHA
jgi:hypothetical protein